MLICVIRFKYATRVMKVSFMLFNELQRFLGEIKTDNFIVSNSEIITLSFTVRKIAIS